MICLIIHISFTMLYEWYNKVNCLVTSVNCPNLPVIIWLVHSVGCFELVRRLRFSVLHFWYRDSNLLFALQRKTIWILIELFFQCMRICLIIFINLAFSGIFLPFLVTLIIWIAFFILKKPTDFEISYIKKVNNLSLGYGASIWYYKNYLQRILPENFKMRVKQYMLEQGVKVACKLYILCPRSCIVQKYIDNTDITWNGELPPYEVNHGGTSDRKYNISVYRIEFNGQICRCAIEYAQPLKNLCAFLEAGTITLDEMHCQRDLFCENLHLFLKDGKNSYETCELIEYDDKNCKLHEVLLKTNSIKESMPAKKI